MERVFAILLLIGGLAGAAAFAHRAGAPADSTFAAPFVQPANHGASSEVLRIPSVPAPIADRPAPSAAPAQRLQLAAPVRRLVPVPVSAPRHVVPSTVSAQPARPAPEPAPPAAVPVPAPVPAPAPAPPAAPVPPAAAAPVVPPPAAPTTTAHGNGKDNGKAKDKNKDTVPVTPLAETAAPVDTVATVEPVVTIAAEVVPAPVAEDAEQQHGRGHGKDK